MFMLICGRVHPNFDVIVFENLRFRSSHARIRQISFFKIYSLESVFKNAVYVWTGSANGETCGRGLRLAGNRYFENLSQTEYILCRFLDLLVNHVLATFLPHSFAFVLRKLKFTSFFA